MEDCKPTDHIPTQDQIPPTAIPEETTEEAEANLSPTPKTEEKEEQKSLFESKNPNSHTPTFQSPPTEHSEDTCNLPYQSHSSCACGGTQSGPNRITLGFSPPSNYRPIRAPALLTPPNTQAIVSAPVPQAVKVPLLSPPYAFQVPVKRISSPADIEHFTTSDSGKTFLGFVVLLSEAIRGRKISDYCSESQVVKFIVGILDEMAGWVDEIPPVQQPARYGNPAYRVWYEKMEQEGFVFMVRVLGQDFREASGEIFPYFADSFGNSLRIDYGTGHETNFAAWLFCLARLGILKENDYQAVVSRVFVKYLGLMRKLQTTYLLEPAGSHGVWGLDDYHFLPFVFGSSQLVNHKYMKPKSIHNEDILENFSNEYLYLSCVAFVKKMKKGPLAEHSPMIDDISGVPNWGKVNSGMLKMYKAEVLEKVPIMQHFLFGSIIKWD
ncbi:uncharacterized protein LOC131078957 [Cryptomeria japonica]|uniref:uncharacterized protein LOC131078957 n=1 Tax=Cryptomeria japonica TaxID=3369 RepID=UPI0027DA2F87|nr:uncharacterized protein LOC131078957 [Cryptomeria japonica]